MLLKNALAASLSLFAANVQAQHVIAHFIAGNAQNPSYDWQRDIQMAHDLGIEAFAFNVVQDSFDSGLVQRAYDAVANSGLEFGIFLQFDFDQSAWDLNNIRQYITDFGAHGAQYKIDGRQLISTFEGGNRAAEWDGVIDPNTMLFIPDWTGSKGNREIFQSPSVGGALSWDVWPYNAETGVSEQIDRDWLEILGPSRSYVMGVSPWFYTNLEQYNKKWLVRGSQLWHTRWESVLNINPPIVEILTWNDFGEGHYIGPNDCAECMPGNGQSPPFSAAAYALGNPHAGFAALLPAYIDAYRSRNSSTAVLEEKLVYAHTTNPVTPAGGCGPDGSKALHDVGPGGDAVAVDAIDVYVVLNEPAEVRVKVGGRDLTPAPLRAGLKGVNFFVVPLNGASGEVEYAVSRGGEVFIGGVEAPGISTDCSGYAGMINYNAVSGVIGPVA